MKWVKDRVRCNKCVCVRNSSLQRFIQGKALFPYTSLFRSIRCISLARFLFMKFIIVRFCAFRTNFHCLRPARSAISNVVSTVVAIISSTTAALYLWWLFPAFLAIFYFFFIPICIFFYNPMDFF